MNPKPLEASYTHLELAIRRETRAERTRRGASRLLVEHLNDLE